MEAQFKIGDKVKILPRDYRPDQYRSTYTYGMTKYVGQIAIICKCTCIEENPAYYVDDGYSYRLDIDKEIYCWNSSMLASLEETSSTPIDKILSQRFTNNKKIYKLNWKV